MSTTVNSANRQRQATAKSPPPSRPRPATGAVAPTTKTHQSDSGNLSSGAIRPLGEVAKQKLIGLLAQARAVLAPADVSKTNGTKKNDYDYYKSLIKKVGPFDPSKPQVLGLRVPTRPDSGANGKFDDVIVVLKDGKVHKFQANTEPAGRYVNSRSDLGQLVANQQITYRPFSGDLKYGDGFEPVGDPKIQRYDNGIGGQLGRVRRDGGGSTMWFNSSLTNKHTGSMGCQTMRPAEMERFNQLLGGKSFTYTLVETGANGVPKIDGSR